MAAELPALIAHLDEQLAPHADAGRAVAERAYLKSHRRFLGVAMAPLRLITRGLDAGLEPQDVLPIAEGLWGDLHEHCAVAVLLLERRARALGPDAVPTLERLLRTSGTWAYVDAIAVHVVGSISLRHDLDPVLDRWSVDEDMWMRRSSLLPSILPVRRRVRDLAAVLGAFERRASRLLPDRTFFVRKAIGWVLREAAVVDPVAVERFVERHGILVSGLTLREATRKLPAEVRDRLKAVRAKG